MLRRRIISLDLYNTFSNAAQDTIILLCHRGTLLPDGQVAVHQGIQILFCKVPSHLVFPQHTLLHVVVLPEIQDFILPLAVLDEVSVSPEVKPQKFLSPFLQSVEFVLDSSTTFLHISLSFQFCVICRLAERTSWPIIQLINEDIKQDWTQHWPRGVCIASYHYPSFPPSCLFLPYLSHLNFCLPLIPFHVCFTLSLPSTSVPLFHRCFLFGSKLWGL